MARNRTPVKKATIEGRDKKDPQRFKNRVEPKVDDGLGEPFAWVIDTEENKAREAWGVIAVTVPWLNASHRILVATASNILGRMIAGQEIGVQATNLLRQCLGQMGATPTDASKISWAPAEKDPDDALFE